MSAIIKMPVADWIRIKDNPIQRDTERHAARAEHLLTPLPVHSIVWAARLPNGSLVKLDGHTRALMWSRNMVELPPKGVEVHVIDVSSPEEAAELYKTFDSKAALETTPDKIAGALKGIKFKPQSPLLQSGSIASALRTAWVGVYGYAKNLKARDEYDMVGEFGKEIMALDDLGIRRGQITTGIISAILLSYRKHGNKVMPFWRSVIANEGDKSGGRMDAVEACHAMMVLKRGNFGGSHQLNVCSRALTAVDKWIVSETHIFHSIPKPLDVTSYLDKVKTEKPKFKLIKRVENPLAEVA